MSRQQIWSTLGVLLLLCGLASAGTKPSNIIVFDAPGAGTGFGQGTISGAINPSGVIAGTYLDASNIFHGFVRTPHGAITAFDPPGSASTLPQSINPAGAIAGFTQDNNGLFHGFARTPDGTFTVFDAPGAGTIAGTGTFAFNINTEGAIAGWDLDNQGVFHGFLRAPDGTIAVFDAPGAGTSSGTGTQTAGTDALNSEGTVTGDYLDANFTWHGYVRAADGSFAEFDAPGAGTGNFTGTVADGINPAGSVAGGYVDNAFFSHGYVRASDGTITEFDVPGVPGVRTIPIGINQRGVIIGYYADANFVNHGFVRDKFGNIATFDVPGAGNNGGTGQGSFSLGINAAGVITGYDIDSNQVFHGFVRLP